MQKCSSTEKYAGQSPKLVALATNVSSGDDE